jgi:hypothetical protein
MRHRVAFSIESERGRAHVLGPPGFADHRPTHGGCHCLIDGDSTYVQQSDGTVQHSGTHGVSVYHVLHCDGASIQDASNCVARMRDLGSVAWTALLQTPTRCWALLDPPALELPHTLVGRTWLGPYRTHFDRERMIERLHKQQESRGIALDYDPEVVLPSSRNQLRGFFRGTDPNLLWLLAVYNIGWLGRAECCFELTRFVWDENARFTFGPLEAELDQFDGRSFGKISTNCPRPIEWFCSEMADPFLKSTFAIDQFLHAADSDTDAPHPVSGSISEIKLAAIDPSANAPLSVTDLAVINSVDPEKLRKRLERWRRKNLDGGWIEVNTRNPRDPKYLYPQGPAKVIADEIRASEQRRSERPPKRPSNVRREKSHS